MLYIVNNYTGDRTAWEMAKEIQEAEGQKIGWLLVNDDVAVKDSTWTVGRRGVAGNFFVIKAAAAMADKGGSLEECVRVGEKVIANVRTMGIALSSCTPPVRGTPLFEIADDEMEVGIGIHGEPGRQRTKIVSANEIVDLLLDAIVPDLPFQSATRSRSWSTASAARRSPSCTCSTGPPTSASPRRASRCSGATSASTAPRSRWPAPHISLLKVDAELKELLLAPAEVSYRVF